MVVGRRRASTTSIVEGRDRRQRPRRDPLPDRDPGPARRDAGRARRRHLDHALRLRARGRQGGGVRRRSSCGRSRTFRRSRRRCLSIGLADGRMEHELPVDAHTDRIPLQTVIPRRPSIASSSAPTSARSSRATTSICASRSSTAGGRGRARSSSAHHRSADSGTPYPMAGGNRRLDHRRREHGPHGRGCLHRLRRRRAAARRSVDLHIVAGRRLCDGLRRRWAVDGRAPARRATRAGAPPMVRRRP